ncbi:MAG: hypothetical protein ABFD54_01935 [Armatimonadota bacterium]|nr:hypothetical protein [bacterium]
MRISHRIKWAVVGLGALCGAVALAIRSGDTILCPLTGLDAVVPLAFAGCLFVLALSVLGFIVVSDYEKKSRFDPIPVIAMACLLIMLASVVIGLASISVWAFRFHEQSHVQRYGYYLKDYSPFDWYIALAISLLSVVLLVIGVTGKFSPKMTRFLFGKSKWDSLPGFFHRYWL